MRSLGGVRHVMLIGRSDSRLRTCLRALVPHLGRRGLRVQLDAQGELDLPPELEIVSLEEGSSSPVDLVVAIGGDGTLLRAAHWIAGRDIPLIGINHGRLGFLTDISPVSMLEDIDRILDGEFIEDRRALLEARIERPQGAPLVGRALNDVVVQKAGQGRILDFETVVDGRFVNVHRGDGLVTATATGSTAYALSCGGPIMVPQLRTLVVTPICPHTLSDRPLVVGADSTIEVRLSPGAGEVLVCCDGIILGPLTDRDLLSMREATTHVTLLHPPDYDYFRLLRSKLRWGRGKEDSNES